MNSSEFQGLCASLEEKYRERTLTDADVDSFADIISNVLHREDLKAEGTPYNSLFRSMAHDYENDIGMNPLLARMYELCRMYDMFRPRPLTEMERKEAESSSSPAASKRAANIVFVLEGRPIAGCWWEDLSDTAGMASKVSEIVSGWKRPGTDDADAWVAAAVRALQSAGGGFDAMDPQGISEAEGLLGEQPAIATERDMGIICIGDGIQRNRARGGAEVKLDVGAETACLDCYTVYGVGFYRELTGDASFSTAGLPVLDLDVDVLFPFEGADRAAADWRDRLDGVFSIPGSDGLVGTGKPLPMPTAQESGTEG